MPDHAPLPDEIVQSIAISNAVSIGEQPVILANLALAQQIFNLNLQQQQMVSHQQAMNQLRLAVVAKCVSLILSDTEGNLQALKETVALLHEAQSAAPADEPKVSDATAYSRAAASAPDASGGALAETITAVAIGNLKGIGEQPAMLANLAYSNSVANTNLSQQNAVANQQSMNELGISVVAKAVNLLAQVGPGAIGDGSSLAGEIASLREVIQAFTAKPA